MTLGTVILILPMLTSASSQRPVNDFATKVFPSLDHESRTVDPSLCDSLTWTLDSSNNYWRHLLFVWDCSARVTFCSLDAPRINSFIYLLTQYTPTYKFLSGCEEVENCTSELVKPGDFPQPRNTTLLHKFYLGTTQMLEYMPTLRLHTRLPHGLVK